MYKNFNITEEEKQQIMEMHQSRGYKQPINEQSTPTNQNIKFEVGKIYNAIRDKDKQKYTIKVTNVSEYYVIAYVNGPGQYEGQPLINRNLELSIIAPNQLSGNSALGTFTITQ